MLFFLGVVFIITEIRLLDNPSTFAAGKSSKTRWGFRFPQTPKTTAPRGSWALGVFLFARLWGLAAKQWEPSRSGLLIKGHPFHICPARQIIAANMKQPSQRQLFIARDNSFSSLIARIR